MKWLAILLVGLAGAAPAQRTKPVVDLRQQVEDQSAEITRLRAEVKELREQVRAMTEQLIAVRRLVSRGDPDGPTGDAERALRPTPQEVAAAIKAQKLLPGMTVEQADRALGVKGELLSEEGGGRQRYEWRVWYTLGAGVDPQGAPARNGKVLHHAFTAIVDGGAIASYDRTNYIEIPK